MLMLALISAKIPEIFLPLSNISFGHFILQLIFVIFKIDCCIAIAVSKVIFGASHGLKFGLKIKEAQMPFSKGENQ